MRITKGEALTFTEQVMSKAAKEARERGDERLEDAAARKATQARGQLEDMSPRERDRVI